jgi:hypothetical protein
VIVYGHAALQESSRNKVKISVNLHDRIGPAGRIPALSFSDFRDW